MISALVLSSLVHCQIPSEISVNEVIKLSWQTTQVIGHRGAAAYQPENTLESFREAIRCQAVAAECDVHLSADGKPFIIHDYSLDRTFPTKGIVKKMNSADLVKAGVPTLNEYLGVTKNKVVSVIEIKDGDGVEKIVVDAVLAHKMEKETIIFGFDANRIEKVKSIRPTLFSVWLVATKVTDESIPKIMERWEQTKAEGMGLQYKNVTPEFAKLLKSKKIPLFIWTVPPGEDVRRLKELGVNFIITDHPRDVRNQLNSL